MQKILLVTYDDGVYAILFEDMDPDRGPIAPRIRELLDQNRKDNEEITWGSMLEVLSPDDFYTADLVYLAYEPHPETVHHDEVLFYGDDIPF